MSLKPLKKRLCLGYTIIFLIAQWGLLLFYIFFSFNLNKAHLPSVLTLFFLNTFLIGGTFSIYIPIRLFKVDISYPHKVVLSNIIGICLLYGITAFHLRYTFEEPYNELIKVPFVALSIGILQCLSSFLFIQRSLYPHIKGSSGRMVSLFDKNLLFIISLVLLSSIIVGISAFNSIGQFSHIAFRNILLAFLIAMTITIALSIEFIGVMRLPLKEISDTAKALPVRDMKNVRAVRGDAVEDLAKAFNFMVEKVREREEELILRGQHLTMLYSLAEALNQQRNYNELFNLTMQWLNTVFGFEVGELRLLKEGFLRLIASKGISEDIIERISSTSEITLPKEDTVVFEDISAFAEPYTVIANELGLECFIGIPLRSKGKLIGVLSTGSRFKRAIYHDSIDILNSLGTLLGIAIERSHEFESIEEERSEWETAISHMADIISIHDKHWRIKKVNPAFLEHLGLKPHEVLGRYCYEVLHGMNMPPPECPQMETLITRNLSTATMETKGNKIISISVHPIFKSHGVMDGSIHVARDVTEIQRLREQLHQADKLGALGRLTAGIAHNVNNPLTYSLNYLYILSEVAVDEKTKELLKKAEEGIKKAKNVLEGLLDFSAPSEGEGAVIDVNEAIMEILAFLSNEIKKKNILIYTELGDNIKVRATKKAMEEVILNLIANSIDASAKKITIETYSEPHGIIITIADNGGGIDKEDLPKIFEPYFTTKPKGKGIGLGLYMSYNIIKSLGGDIWCNSKKGTGTHFFILLPTLKA